MSSLTKPYEAMSSSFDFGPYELKTCSSLCSDWCSVKVMCSVGFACHVHVTLAFLEWLNASRPGIRTGAVRHWLSAASSPSKRGGKARLWVVAMSHHSKVRTTSLTFRMLSPPTAKPSILAILLRLIPTLAPLYHNLLLHRSRA